MADYAIVVPPIQPTAPAALAIPFSQAVTTAAATISSTNYACYAVVIQSAAFNDSNAARTGVTYVQLSVDGGVTFTNAWELQTGESVCVQVNNTQQIKVLTQSGTAHVRGFIYSAKTLG
jgi:hypothetical protein